MLVTQVLRFARALLATGWSQGAQARDEHGEAVDPLDERAESWSLTGAIKTVVNDAGDQTQETERLARTALAVMLAIRVEQLEAWNDSPERTQHEVLAACDSASEVVAELIAKHLAPFL